MALCGRFAAHSGYHGGDARSLLAQPEAQALTEAHAAASDAAVCAEMFAGQEDGRSGFRAAASTAGHPIS
jgi:hypothetical protein